MTLYEISQMIVQFSPSVFVLILIVMSLIEVAPIKVNPWQAIVKGIGRALNAETNKKIEDMDTRTTEKMEQMHQDYNSRCDAIQRDVSAINNALDEHIKESNARDLRERRESILSFASAIAAGKNYTKERFNQILRECDEYESFCVEKQFKNSVAVASMAIIKRTYEQHMVNNDFLAIDGFDDDDDN